MGQLFGQGLTQSSLVSPSGQTTAMGSPQQMQSGFYKQGIADEQKQHPYDPSQPNPNPAPQSPSIGKPSFQQAASFGAPPGGANALSPGLTKGGKLLTLLMAGGQGALAGRAAQEQATVQSGGRRSGGAGMAMEAGYNLPWQRAGMAQEMEQKQAQTELTKTQSQMVPTPYGQMPAGLAKLMFPAMIRAQGQQNVQGMKGDTAESIQQQKGQAAENVAGINKRFMAVPNVGLYDTQSKQLIPGTQQGINITPEIAKDYQLPQDFIGKPMNVSQLAQIEKAQTMRAGKTSDTVDYREDENGNIIALPKRTTTTPNIPGVSGSQPPAPTGTSNPAGGPRIVGHGKEVGMVVGTDSQGRQVAGTPADLRGAGVNSFTKLDSGEAAKVNTARQLVSPNGLFGLIDKDLAQFKPGELEALGPRWNEFLAGTVGTADKRYVALRTHVNGLLSTALMQAHVGARGGERIMEHFEDIANSGKMALPTLKAALGAERDYVQEKAMRPQAMTPQGGGGGQARPQGATHIVPGPDGKNHYTNAQGTVDLGVAP